MLSTPVKIVCGGEWLNRRWQLMLFFTGQDTADANDTHGHFFKLCPFSLNWGKVTAGFTAAVHCMQLAAGSSTSH